VCNLQRQAALNEAGSIDYVTHVKSSEFYDILYRQLTIISF